MVKQTAKYGTWDSPLTSGEIYKASTGIAEVYVDEVTKQIYHLESRPSERGRSVLCHSLPPHGDLVPKEVNVRTGVHEYGGAPASVRAGIAYYSDVAKQSRVWKIELDAKSNDAVAITPDTDIFRYADFAIHPTDSNWVVAIRQDHSIDLPSKVVNTLVLIQADRSRVHVIKSGNDFYASPRWSPDGRKLAWMEWSHPDMPWEGAELYYAHFETSDLTLGTAIHVAGKHNEIAVNQPTWYSSPGQDVLTYLCDETGFFNLYSTGTSGNDKPRLAMQRIPYDIGEPTWMLGLSTYATLTSSAAVVAYIKDSESVLAYLDLETGSITTLKGSECYRKVTQVRRLSETQFVFLGDTAFQETALVIVTLGIEAGSAYFKEVETSSSTTKPIDKDYVSVGQTHRLSVPWSPDAKRPKGIEKGQEVELNVTLFSPTNPNFQGPEGSKPPCLVGVHGGPTSQAWPIYNDFYQYFTTRGYAVLDVNYGGSSGYGRLYRQRLASNWGVVDVHDTIQAVIQLGKMGKIDPDRVAIRGGSAGGYTTLACLTDSKVFKAGVSLYGVTDVNLLATDTHKFESQYMFKLMGGRPKEIPQVYHDRSPINKAENITASLLVMQGEDDKVVPPAQARELIKKIKAVNGTVESVFYKGEGHGFRKVENMIDSLDRTDDFLKRVL